jgi:hypothetical protein
MLPRRQPGVETAIVGQNPDPALHRQSVRGGVVAINQGTAAVGLQNRVQHAQCRCLVGAVGADKTGNFAIARGKFNTAQDLYAIEALAQSLDFNHLPPPLKVIR